ncbi:MAG: helix-turn-helix domain-containing protein [Clostridia bacterium]|nr:helix-turn-helix domain-containing protein [Clostridia bacterium]
MGKVFSREKFNIYHKGAKIAIVDAHHDGRMEPHSHSFYEMVYVQSGFTLHSCSGEVRMLSAGDWFFVRPGEEHSYINANGFQIFNCIFLEEALGGDLVELKKLPGLDYLLSDSWIPDPASTDPVTFERVLRVDVSERRSVEKALETIRTECENRQTGWELSAKSRLLALLVRYSRLYEQQKGQQKTTASDYYMYIYKILQYVNENYRKEISMADLSGVTGLSVDYMSRRFKAVMHLSPAEYIRRFRIAKAMELLSSTDFPIARIAEETGFSDISLFSRVFKNAVGVPPASYRKNQK